MRAASESRAAAARAALSLGLKLDQAGRAEEANAAMRTAMEQGAASGTPEGRVTAALAALPPRLQPAPAGC